MLLISKLCIAATLTFACRNILDVYVKFQNYHLIFFLNSNSVAYTKAKRVILPRAEPVCLPGIQSDQLNRFSMALAASACLQSPPHFTAETKMKTQCLETCGKPQSSSLYNERLFTWVFASTRSSAFPHLDSGGGGNPECSRKWMLLLHDLSLQRFESEVFEPQIGCEVNASFFVFALGIWY